uniref:Uncharacterized protein n=1 Tax=viral metagenome TaxID=1070528 RepID=A0A6M3JWT8_9ZZZZ
MLVVSLDKTGMGKVLIDGRELENVTGVTITSNVGEVPKADITILDEIIFDGPVEVNIVDRTGRKINLAAYLKFSQ